MVFLQESGRVYLCGDFAASVFRLPPEMPSYQASLVWVGKGEAYPKVREEGTIQLEGKGKCKLSSILTSSKATARAYADEQSETATHPGTTIAYRHPISQLLLLSATTLNVRPRLQHREKKILKADNLPFWQIGRYLCNQGRKRYNEGISRKNTRQEDERKTHLQPACSTLLTHSSKRSTICEPLTAIRQQVLAVAPARICQVMSPQDRLDIVSISSTYTSRTCHIFWTTANVLGNC